MDKMQFWRNRPSGVLGPLLCSVAWGIDQLNPRWLFHGDILECRYSGSRKDMFIDWPIDALLRKSFHSHVLFVTFRSAMALDDSIGYEDRRRWDYQGRSF